MDSVDSIIEAFQGVSSLGEAIGASPQTVTNMRSRKSIPAKYWLRLVEEAGRRGIAGITYEALARMAAGLAPGGSASSLEAAPADVDRNVEGGLQ